MRAAIIDIETTDLAAVGAGIVTCVCIQSTYTLQTKTFHLGMYEYEPDDNFGFLEREERSLLADVRIELQKYHILIGHNIDFFDIPYLQSRAYRLGVDWDLSPFTYDTLKAFRRTRYLTKPNYKGKPSAGLAMVADFLGIHQEKTSIYPAEWWKQVWGNREQRNSAIQEIVLHCQADVRLNNAVFDFLWITDLRGTMRRFL